MKNSKTWNLNSLLVHSGNDLDFSKVKTPSTPIFQTSNYTYEDVESGTDILLSKSPGYIYARYSNPTVDTLNRIMADIEGGEAALSFGTGLAAISAVTMSYCKPGDHIVASSLIYGGTYHLFQEEFAKLGVETTFVDPTDLAAVKSAVKPNTRFLYTEPLANPVLISSDISAWREIAQEKKLPLILDNTFTPPPIIKPLAMGADIVIHSATKYLGGHSDLTGGVVVSSRENIEKISPALKYHGGIMAPMIAWLLIRGIRTLGVRLERQCKNAQKIAEFLEQHPHVEKVNYAGLPSNPQFEFNQKQFNQYSGMLSFEVKGGFEPAKQVMQNLNLIEFTVSLGDVASLISHPASTSHVYLTEEERLSFGVTPGLLRLSVGIESVEDLISDLDDALND